MKKYLSNTPSLGENEVDNKKSRLISRVVSAKTTTEGEGFVVHRAFPNNDLREFDPFLLLDEIGPIVLSPGEAKGAPDHPHRGFSTVTYMIDGIFEHKDSQGHSGKIQPGDIQWMTAGSGVIHSEMPEKEFAKSGGRLHGFQLWINLPKKDKMIKPQYRDISASNIQQVTSLDGKVKVKIISGESLGKRSLVELQTSIIYLHVTLQPSAKFEQTIPENYNVFAYVIDGNGLFGDGEQPAHKEQIVLFEKFGNLVKVKVPGESKTPLEFLLIAGVPLDEAVARYGPFVMNTEEEIRQAITDYNTGKMGKIDF